MYYKNVHAQMVDDDVIRLSEKSMLILFFFLFFLFFVLDFACRLIFFSEV